MHGIKAPGTKLLLWAIGYLLLSMAAASAAFAPSTPIAAAWQAQTNLGAPPFGISVPADAITFETFDRPNGHLGTNLVLQSGEILNFRSGNGGLIGSTNCYITNGCLIWYPIDEGGGASLYCTLTLTNVPNKDYVLGVRARWTLVASGGGVTETGLAFGIGNGDGGQWSITNLLARKLIHGGWAGNASLAIWQIDQITNWSGTYPDDVAILSDDRPNRQDARLTNTWHTFEIGHTGPNILYLSADGYATNFYGWHVDDCWGTNLFLKFDNASSNPMFRLQIDALWVRSVPQAAAGNLITTPSTLRPRRVTASGANGTYYARQDDTYIGMPAGVSNVYLPGGLWIGSPVTGSSARKMPADGQILFVKDESGNASGTNIHVFGLRYTNDTLWGQAWHSNYFWDFVDGGPSNRITTARGVLRLICRGTNWYTW